MIRRLAVDDPLEDVVSPLTGAAPGLRWLSRGRHDARAAVLVDDSDGTRGAGATRSEAYRRWLVCRLRQEGEAAAPPGWTVGVGIGADEGEASWQASLDLLARLRSRSRAHPVPLGSGPLGAAVRRLVPSGVPSFFWLGVPGLPAVPMACSWEGAVAVAAAARPEEAAWAALLDAVAAASHARWAAARERWAGVPSIATETLALRIAEPVEGVPATPGTPEEMSAWERAQGLEIRRRTWAPSVLAATGEIALAAFVRTRDEARPSRPGR